ncbi:DUF2637 domain-containing protein [Amycolatopsis albispora]|uniref:DUF2637 domain-containing protein n=1 Tax=Amycolatopsis albispora TaxID=1804986 RepID=A0A344L8X3_9PSEU|nr:DUF2637 domain-containing protein [Amycolatopsis albispora]AXB44497.1 hypothetical protein A4R43_19910 [Amycolatopsis albispora]
MSTTIRRDLALWVQCFCTALVALDAAYASYRHGRDFALRFGSDHTTAAIWPLIVDGLLIIATVELWKGPAKQTGRWAAWLAFTLGISLSLCANIAAAPHLSVFAIAVAACPPLALLLAVELLNRALKRHRTTHNTTTESGTASTPRQEPTAPAPLSAEERMWQHYLAELEQGRTPTGAELDRVAGTHNYGRRLLRKWRATGRLPDHKQDQQTAAGTTSRQAA